MSDKTWQILRFSLLGALLLWGGYTLLEYLVLPVHQLVLLTEGQQATLAAACDGGSFFCQATHVFFPFITHTIGRMAPFLAYGIISLLFYIALIGWDAMESGEWRVRFMLSPWKLLLLFVASVWLFFTVMGFVDNDGNPIRRIFEPLPQVYVNAGPEALKTLRENYDDLKNSGCLTYIGMTTHGAEVNDMKASCMQMAFISRVVPQMLVLLLLLSEMLILGRALLRLMRAKEMNPITEMILSLGLGACGFMLILWALAVGHIYTMLAGWLTLAVIPVVCYPDTRHWAEKFLWSKWKTEDVWYGLTVIVGWLLISYLALNFLNVIRPFPIGWDDLGRYVNQPRLLISYGQIIPTMASFQWEYLTSLGFLLFGYDSVVGATAAMQINWLAGLVAVLVIYAFGALFLGRKGGVLAALIYYTLPMVGHFSFADMKVDNAVFAMGSLSVLAMFLYLFPTSAEREEGADAHVSPARTWQYIVLAGVFGGFAFSMKPTTIMVLMAIGPAMLAAITGWMGFAGGIALAWATFTAQGRFNAGDVSARIFGSPDVLRQSMILWGMLLIGIIFLGYALYERRSKLKIVGTSVGLFIASFAVVIAPWLLFNNVLYGNVVPKLVLTMPNTLSATFSIAGEEVEDRGQVIRSLPKDLQVDMKHEACSSTSKSEELDRYWGYGSGIGHYLGLPWRSVMNTDAVGYYVTLVPFLLCFPLLLLLPYFWRKEGKWLRWLFFATLFMLLQWMFFANGIAWYGIGMFLGMAVGLEALVRKSPDPATKAVAGVLCALSILVGFAMRFWQFEQQRNVFEYPLGKVSAEAMKERTIPYYDDIRDEVMKRYQQFPDRPYVYRMGTFIPYFIPKNLEVLPVADNQLDFFNCINQEKNPELTLKRIKALGFNSFIFDTNTQTIEKDENGTLHKKVQAFVDFVNTPGLGLDIVVNDPEAGIAFVLIN